MDVSSHRVFAVALALVMIAPGLPSRAEDEPRSFADTASRAVAESLDRAWPARPDAIDMLADILIKGDQISGGDGWFRKPTGASRFDWPATRRALDADGDGSVSRAEFGGRAGDFARLDRDADGALGVADFNFTPSVTSPSAGPIFFARADRDGNGKLTREEFAAFFRDTDSDGLGFLSLADVQNVLTPGHASPAGPTSGPPTRGTFLRSYFRRELGAFHSGPSLDEPAPDFTLRTAEGGGTVTLSKVIGPKPVVLVFGNLTCGPFRSQAGNLAKLHERYKDRASFLMVYVREPHPTDGWRMDHNDRAGVAVRQPRSDQERQTVAQTCSRTLGLGFPMLVDTIDDTVNNRYSGIPSRLYLIDRRGKIAFKNGRGPVGFRLAELEQSLLLLLRESAGPPDVGAEDRTP